MSRICRGIERCRAASQCPPREQCRRSAPVAARRPALPRLGRFAGGAHSSVASRRPSEESPQARCFPARTTPLLPSSRCRIGLTFVDASHANGGAFRKREQPLDQVLTLLHTRRRAWPSVTSAGGLAPSRAPQLRCHSYMATHLRHGLASPSRAPPCGAASTPSSPSSGLDSSPTDCHEQPQAYAAPSAAGRSHRASLARSSCCLCGMRSSGEKFRQV